MSINEMLRLLHSCGSKAAVPKALKLGSLRLQQQNSSSSA
jgi:hypothetical protein